MSEPLRKIDTDICVIGAGSGGLSVAAGAAQLGRDVVLVERGEMGGDCLNRGCVPSKALLAAGKAAQHAREAERFGVHTGEVRVDYAAVHDHLRGVIDAIAPNDSQERFEGLGCTVLREEARFTGPNSLVAGKTEVHADHFVLATGSSPLVPEIEGLKDVPFLTNETLFDLTEAPRHLLIVGGGPIGCEMAQAHRRLGCEVTVVEGGTILGKDDPELTAILKARLREEGVVLEENAHVARVRKEGEDLIVTASRDGEDLVVRGSHILVAVGRSTDTSALDLETAGVETNEKGVLVDAQLRTTNKRIYAIGDVNGGLQFTHVAGYQAGIVIRNMLFKVFPQKNDPHRIPHVTYTEPELASVGLTEAQAKEENVSYEVARWNYDENDRAQAERATTGFAKILIGRRGKILGASIIGEGAGELIGAWSLAIANGLKASAFTSTVMPYPTLSEVSKRAAGAYYSPRLFSGRTKRLVGVLSRFD